MRLKLSLANIIIRA